MGQYQPTKNSKESIATIDSLCVALSISIDELNQALSMPIDERYTPPQKELFKSDGTPRVAYKPHHLIRKIQRRINKRILGQEGYIDWPDHVFGSVPNKKVAGGEDIVKDYINCARQHCLAKSLLKMDVKDFFDNIHVDLVFSIFNKFLSFSADVSTVLANICCRGEFVVQGGLTSSYLACLCLFDVEGEVVIRLKNKGLVYTRLIDDVTVSSKRSGYDFSFARQIIEDMLFSRNLPINSKKTAVHYHSSAPLMVHGLRISFKEPRLPASEVKKIRAAVKDIEILAKDHLYRITHAYRHDFNRVMGRVNKLKRIGHTQHENLKNRMLKLYPLPSFKDITRARLAVERVERDYEEKGGTYWYKKRFYRAHERLNLLKRSFPDTASELRERLRGLRPVYD
ncbi:reverse transcriptase family protein [Pseudomonas aeruginosa]|uniref:reverse transcriptase family protein n=1 Tax=Pseudomonas aeruginosa TaxID=287 RepID=UPI000FC433DE|nr:reverse transcriptase family protein [Pseudomonas aeruginosa]RUC69068.1 RNA-directed DNA polymerase [Pseudomonas aeruginosa]